MKKAGLELHSFCAISSAWKSIRQLQQAIISGVVICAKHKTVTEKTLWKVLNIEREFDIRTIKAV